MNSITKMIPVILCALLTLFNIWGCYYVGSNMFERNGEAQALVLISWIVIEVVIVLFFVDDKEVKDEN